MLVRERRGSVFFPESLWLETMKLNRGTGTGPAFEVVNCFSQGGHQQFCNRVPGQAQVSKWCGRLTVRGGGQSSKGKTGWTLVLRSFRHKKATHTHTHAHTHARAHTCTHTYMHVHTRMHTRTCAHTHTHTCTLTHIHAHTQTHAHTTYPCAWCTHMHMHM